MSFLDNKIFLISITFIAFLGAKLLQRRTGIALLNPILVSIIILVLFLTAFGIDYDSYLAGGEYIDFWLKPAVVALGVPLYRQLETIRKQMLPLLIAELAGCVAGVISVVVVAQLLGASKEVIMSLAPKAVTTPIAMEISQSVGGIPSLTAAVVVCTGIFGGMTGFQLVKLSHIKSPIATGLSIGTAAHAVGTSAAMEKGERYGTFSSLGLTLNGLLTAMLAPAILSFLGLEYNRISSGRGFSLNLHGTLQKSRTHEYKTVATDSRCPAEYTAGCMLYFYNRFRQSDCKRTPSAMEASRYRCIRQFPLPG